MVTNVTFTPQNSFTAIDLDSDVSLKSTAAKTKPPDSGPNAVVDSLPTQEQRDEAGEYVTIVNMACESQESSASAAKRFTGAAGHFASELHSHLLAFRQASRRAPSPSETYAAAMTFLGRVLKNDFDSTAGRWGATAFNVALRTGLNAAVFTVMRQMTATMIEYNLVNDEVDEETLKLLGIGSQLLGPVLNLAGAAIDEYNGTASRSSRLSRLAMLGFSGIGAASASVMSVQSHLASFGYSIWAYSGGRAMQALFPMKDNGGPLGFKSTVKAAGVYGVSQFIGSEAMDRWGPNSGAGSVKGAGQAYPFTLKDDLVRGAINGAIEVVDGIASNYFRRNDQIKKNLLSKPADRLKPADTEGLRIGFDTPLLCSGMSAGEMATKLRNQVFITESMRISAFSGGSANAAATNALVAHTSLSSSAQGRVVNAAASAMIAFVYPGVIMAHDQPDAPAMVVPRTESLESGPEEESSMQRRIPETA